MDSSNASATEPSAAAGPTVDADATTSVAMETDDGNHSANEPTGTDDGEEGLNAPATPAAVLEEGDEMLKLYAEAEAKWADEHGVAAELEGVRLCYVQQLERLSAPLLFPWRY